MDEGQRNRCREAPFFPPGSRSLDGNIGVGVDLVYTFNHENR